MAGFDTAGFTKAAKGMGYSDEEIAAVASIASSQKASNTPSFSGNRATDIQNDIANNGGKNVANIKSYYDAKDEEGKGNANPYSYVGGNGNARPPLSAFAKTAPSGQQTKTGGAKGSSAEAQVRSGSFLGGIGKAALGVGKAIVNAPHMLGEGLGMVANAGFDQKSNNARVEADRAAIQRNLNAARKLQAAGKKDQARKLLDENARIAKGMQGYTNENMKKTEGNQSKTNEKLVKGGVGTAAFFAPTGATRIARLGTGAGVGAAAGFSQSKTGEELPDIVGGALTGFGTVGVLESLPLLKGAFVNRSTQIKQPNILQKSGAYLKNKSAPIYKKANVFGAEQEKAINETLDKLGLKGTAQMKYQQLAPEMRNLGQGIANELELKSQNVTHREIRSAFLDNLKDTMRVTKMKNGTARTEINAYLKDLGNIKQGTRISTKDLFRLKTLVNGDYQSVYKKIVSGSTLTPRDQVIAAARNTFDNIITKYHPEVKEATLMQSHLYDAAQSLNTARKTVPTARFMGTTIPVELSQGVTDTAGRISTGVGNKVAGVTGAIGALPDIVAGAASKIPLPKDEGLRQVLRNVGISSLVGGLGEKPSDQLKDAPQNVASDPNNYTGEDNASGDLNHDTNDTLPDVGSQEYVTGHSPQEWQQAIQKAFEGGDEEAAKLAQQQYKSEIAYQKDKSKMKMESNMIPLSDGRTFVPRGALTTDQKKKLQSISEGMKLVDQVEEMYKEAVGKEYGGIGSGIAARVKGVKRVTGEFAGTNQKFRRLRNFLDSNRAPIAKGIKGEVGNLNETEQKKALKSFPDEFSSPYEAEAAFADIRKQMLNNLTTLGYVTTAPSFSSYDEALPDIE